MTEDLAFTFFKAFAEDDFRAWQSAFTERDRTALFEAKMAAQRHYAPGTILNFGRPRRARDDFFEGRGKEKAERLRRRQLYAIAVDAQKAVFYTDYGSPPDGTSGAQRLVAADMEGGPRIVQIAMFCPYCAYATGICEECGGTGWKVQQESKSIGDLPAPTLLTPPPRDTDAEAYRALGMDL